MTLSLDVESRETFRSGKYDEKFRHIDIWPQGTLVAAETDVIVLKLSNSDI